MSLLPICSNIFDRLLFGCIINFMIQNNLLNSCQSGFRPNDSCVNQLIPVTRDVFLDLLKAFDNVWREGASGKLKNNGIKRMLFN